MAATPTDPPGAQHETLFSSTFLSPAVREVLPSLLWPPTNGHHPGQETEDDLKAYFSYFQQECRPDAAPNHAISSLQDLTTILDILRTNTNAVLSRIRSLIRDANPALATDERKLSLSIELVVRLWIMVNVKILMPAHRGEFDISLPWPDDQSLLSVLRRHISQPRSSYPSVANSFSPYLNAVQMRDIANFQVLWTNNLGDHLSIRESSLCIFYHVSVLKLLKNSTAGDFLPTPLIDETLATINLLIPHSMPRCNTWLQTQISHMGLDPNILYRETADRRRNVYAYWLDRLLAVSEAFDKSKPSNPIQWWHDRRDMGQWWGFWLVIAGIFLTVLFGLIQSITGILQVVKSSG